MIAAKQCGTARGTDKQTLQFTLITDVRIAVAFQEIKPLEMNV